METLQALLFPLIWLFGKVLEGFHDLTGSYGVSILGLSLFVALVTWPLARYAQKIEARDRALHEAMAPKIAAAKQQFKGEQRFHAIDAVYKQHNYHPIKSMKSVAGFGVQLPFLLTSLLLLISHPSLAGEKFLLVPNLSQPDALLCLNGFSMNILPLAMTAVTLCEAFIKPEMTREGRRKFYFIAAGLLLLVYALPSGVVIYWTTSNLVSLAKSAFRAAKS